MLAPHLRLSRGQSASHSHKWRHGVAIKNAWHCCAGMAVSCVQQLCVAFANTKYLSIAAVALGSVANISFPAISSIKSKSVPRHEQVASPA